MKKRIILFLIITVLAVSSVSVFSFAEEAEVLSAVEIKLNKLKEVYPTGSYFTKSGNAADRSDWSDVSSLEIDSQLAVIPSRGGLPAGSEVGKKGTSCYAFAMYCFYYIFGHHFYQNVTKTETAKVGDAILFWYSGGAEASHYAIYLGEDETNYYVYDANWNHDCAVREYGKVRKSKYAYVTVYRANGYDTLTAENDLSEYHTLANNGSVIKKGDTVTLDMPIPENEGYDLVGYSLVNSRGEYVMENGQKKLFLQGGAVLFDENIVKYPSDTFNFEAVWEKSHRFSDFVSDNNAAVAKDGTKTRVCAECGEKETLVDVGSRLLCDTGAVFDDVEALWYKKAVDYCYTYGLFAGVTDTHFGVSDTVTRGMYVTVLARIAGVTPDKTATTEFADVEAGRYYTYAIAWAKQAGIVAGVSETEFCPEDPITRAQLCVMTVNFAKFMQIEITGENEAIVFADAEYIPNWAKDAVNVCTRSRIVSGYYSEDGVFFDPGATATRAESAQILYKFYEGFIIPTIIPTPPEPETEQQPAQKEE